MDGIDSSTWQALGLTLTVAGLLASALVWRRRGPAAGLRAVAWSLLPAAAGLTGVLRLLWQIGGSVAGWVTRLVLSPLVWAGILVAGVSAVLFVVSGVMRHRGIGSRRTSRPAGTPPPERRSAVRSRPAGDPAGDGDMDDIEAILRKHGIT